MSESAELKTAKAVEELRDEVMSIRANIDKVFAINPQSKIPLGLRTLLEEALRCATCRRSPLKSPVVVSKCCNQIVHGV